MLAYYIISNGHHPFGDEISCCMQNIALGRLRMAQSVDALALSLLGHMLEPEPSRRASVTLCLRHPYFWCEPRLHFITKRPYCWPLVDAFWSSGIENCSNAYNDLLTYMETVSRDYLLQTDDLLKNRLLGLLQPTSIPAQWWVVNSKFSQDDLRPVADLLNRFFYCQLPEQHCKQFVKA